MTPHPHYIVNIIAIFPVIKSDLYFYCTYRMKTSRHQWPRGLRRGSAGASLMELVVRIQPRVLTSVSWVCCVLSGRSTCFGTITRPAESYRVWLVWVRSWSLDNEKALVHKGAVAPWGRKICKKTHSLRKITHTHTHTHPFCIPCTEFHVARMQTKFGPNHIKSWGLAVAQLVEALRYQAQGRGFASPIILGST